METKGILPSLLNTFHALRTTVLQLIEVPSSPAARANVGALYTKSDNLLYFRDGGGTEHTMTDHVAVTLAADADTILGLSTQQLTLDSQAANAIFAGPTSGAAADPAFRALVDADLPLHGAAEHDNRTRNLWIPAGAFYNTYGSPVLAGVHGLRGSAWLMDSAAYEAICAEMALPEDWASGTVAFKLYFTMAEANTTDAVVLTLRLGSFADGESMAAGTPTANTVTVPDAADTLKVHTHTATLVVAAGELLQIQVSRSGADAADTAAGDLQFLGMILSYTADE